MKATQRLDKIVGHSGQGSRSEIKLMVKRGEIEVNGKIVKDSGIQVNTETDVIIVAGVRLFFKPNHYLMLNKPQGVISATEDSRERTVIDLLAGEWKHLSLFPVGRLDKDTEGLLLLTNDGKLSHNLLSPRKHVPKTYYAEVSGKVDLMDQTRFAEGVMLEDGYVTLPAQLVILTEGDPQANKLSKIELTIMEGKFHQVKRMFIAVGKKVEYLQRIRMGSLKLDDNLYPGDYRELTSEELAGLKGESSDDL